MRYGMVIDLRRCVGCQTCTATCKQANATPPGVQWRKVLDIEYGEYPEVRRSFLPVACMHCSEPPCEEVCPSTATRKREDGLITIDYDLCIGCGNCVVACPYQARSIVHEANFAYGQALASEALRFDDRRLGVATKCSFCQERVDQAGPRGLKPGIDAAVTPACVNACISGALQFGDLDDPESNVSRALAAGQSFRMHEEIGTQPGVYYVWDQK